MIEKFKIKSVFFITIKCYISIPWWTLSIFFQFSSINVIDKIHGGTCFFTSSCMCTVHFREEPPHQKIIFSWGWRLYQSLRLLAPLWVILYEESVGEEKLLSLPISMFLDEAPITKDRVTREKHANLFYMMQEPS